MSVIICQHRINTSTDLINLNPSYGVEFDLRDFGKDLILAHDPYKGGEKFEDYAKQVGNRFLIVNVKSEGVENLALEILQKNKIENFFFLDLSFPALIKMSKKNEKRLCARFSKYEPMEFVERVKDVVSWVWADYFDYQGIKQDDLKKIHDMGLKVCIVSPELVDINAKYKISEYIETFKNEKPDMICTKYPELWSTLK